MTHPILVTGAAGGTQGSTGRLVASLLMERGIPVRALVHHVDARSDELRRQGAEVVEGDLLTSASVQAVMRNVKRAYFTYPVADGRLRQPQSLPQPLVPGPLVARASSAHRCAPTPCYETSPKTLLRRGMQIDASPPTLLAEVVIGTDKG